MRDSQIRGAVVVEQVAYFLACHFVSRTTIASLDRCATPSFASVSNLVDAHSVSWQRGVARRLESSRVEEKGVSDITSSR